MATNKNHIYLTAKLPHGPYCILYKLHSMPPQKHATQTARKNLGEEGMSLNVLPEGCIANVLAFTGPRDACRLSIVSSLFKSAGESDAVWERFLPRDYQSIIFTSDSYVLLSSLSSKKELYLRLCEKPIIIDDGKKVTLMSISSFFFPYKIKSST